MKIKIKEMEWEFDYILQKVNTLQDILKTKNELGEEGIKPINPAIYSEWISNVKPMTNFAFHSFWKEFVFYLSLEYQIDNLVFQLPF